MHRVPVLEFKKYGFNMHLLKYSFHSEKASLSEPPFPPTHIGNTACLRVVRMIKYDNVSENTLNVI